MWVRQGRGRSRRRDQHLHRLQPGLPRPRVRRQEGLLPAQSAGRARDRADPGCRPATHKRVAVVGAGPAGLSAAVAAAAARPHRPPVRGRRHIGGQFAHRRADSRQGGVRRDHPLLPAATRGHRRRGPPGHPRSPPTDLIEQKFDDVVARDRCHPADARHPRHRPPEGAVVRRCRPRSWSRSARRVAVIGAGGIGFDVSEFLTVERLPHAGPQGVEAANGVSPMT